MTQEKEFSFARLFKFAARYAVIAVLLVAIGLGLGVASALTAKKFNYEKYTGSMVLNLANYAAISRIDYTQDATVLNAQAAQIIETATSASIKTKTFEALHKELYPLKKTEMEKLELFLSALEIKTGTNSLCVNFVYDVNANNDTARTEQRTVAKKVISTYLALAATAVREQHSLLENDQVFEYVFTINRAEQSYDLTEDFLAKNEDVSIVSRAVIGAIAGAVVAAAVIFALYLLLPHIKSVEDVLPAQKAAVLHTKDKNAAIALVARAKAAGAKRLAVLSLSKDDDYLIWTNDLVEQLKRSGISVKVVCFTAQDSEWLSYFRSPAIGDADLELYLYNDDITAIASYIASNADLSAFFVNQRKVKARTLAQSVEAISGDSYGCTVIHNPNLSYVG